MTSGDLDRILASDASVGPSSTFTRSVMAAVHREAAEPARLSFPWVRFGIGVAACNLMAAAATFLFSEPSPLIAPLNEFLTPVAAIAPELSCAAAVLLVGAGISAIPRVLSRY